jgi:diketogulonate reductase-like aldo/keto reductase
MSSELPSVSPTAVPQRVLASGATMPAIGLGTFGSDHVTAGEVAGAVEQAIKGGYRLIDCAACYLNEAEIGQVFTRLIPAQVARADMFIMSKLWNDQHAPADVARAARKTLADLHLDYLDAYFVHWPFPNSHRPKAAPDERNPDSRPYIHAEFMDCWQAMEHLVDEGLVRHLGVSNMTIPKLDLVLADARIKPVLHEMEVHPCFQQGELFQYCVDHDITPIAFSPIGSPARPERDKAEGDFTDIEMPEVQAIAAAHGVHPAVVCVKWAVQRGLVPIPFSVKPSSFLSNLQAVTTDPLTPTEMDLMRGVERNSRLIKGQVFLWPGSTDWRDLWDVDGTIPGWDGYAAKGQSS